MRILFVGDIFGSLGRAQLKAYLKKLKQKHNVDLTIVNGENSAGGKGITEKIYKEILNEGADFITLGNHAFDKKEVFDFFDDADQIIRPANFPEDTPGKGIGYVKVSGVEVAIINLQGRVFLPPLEDPFRYADQLVAEARKRTPIIFIDFHAEATSEKLALGWYLDGRVSALVGTHTHVQTADARLLDQGTAYITDVGMTGPYDGIIGVERDAVLKKFLTQLPVRFNAVEKGKAQLSAVVIDVSVKTGKATKIERILITDDTPFFS